MDIPWLVREVGHYEWYKWRDCQSCFLTILWETFFISMGVQPKMLEAMKQIQYNNKYYAFLTHTREIVFSFDLNLFYIAIFEVLVQSPP